MTNQYKSSVLVVFLFSYIYNIYIILPIVHLYYSNILMVYASMFSPFRGRNFYHDVNSKTYFGHTFYSTRFSLRETRLYGSFCEQI